MSRPGIGHVHLVEVKSRGFLGYKAVNDADYTATVADEQIGFAKITAPRTIFLPDVDTYELGQELIIADESGRCSVDRSITISVSPGSNDTIAGLTSIKITDAYQFINLRRGADNLWIVYGQADFGGTITPVSGAF